jgi:hypothetical protein
MARKSKRAAGLIDYRIHLDCHRTHFSESDRHPRRISLSAIGRCLKDQYDAFASSDPPASHGSRQTTWNAAIDSAVMPRQVADMEASR